MTIIMNNLTPITFEIDDFTNWQKYLVEEGYVVIKDILSLEEHDTVFNLFENDINSVSSAFDISDSSTWKIENTPLMYGKGMGVFNGFGQSNFMWELRTNPKIQNIFKKVHNCEEIVTSLDGFSLFVNKNQKSKSWLHIDQNPVNTIYSVQGSYNLFEVGEQDAGFIVNPKSHLTYKPEVKHKKDWIMVDQEEFIGSATKLVIPGNCFTLWNSKLIHANVGIPKTNQTTQESINRLTAYITYLPKEKRSQEILEKRIEAYKNGKTTSHWANKCELKTYPFGFKTRYESRGFLNIIPKLNENGEIPIERLNLL